MRPATRILGGSTLALFSAGAIATAVAESIWSSASKRMMKRLREDASRWPAKTVSPRDLEGLPEPVERYFRLVLTPGQPIARTVDVRHQGSFRLGDDEGRWIPFYSRQRYSTRPRGFVWDARMRVLPLVTIRVRDAYLDGRGSVLAKVGSVLTVADERGRTGIDSGALHRWLAEAVWFPTALLPTEGVEWVPIDGQSARATLTDGPNRVSLDFTFSERGEIVRAFTSERMRMVDGKALPTPWVCHYRDYHRRGPQMVPESGDVEWVLSDHRLPYWRGRIARIELD